MSLQTGFIGNVKSTNKIDIEVKPYETVTISGLLKKDQRMEYNEAVTEQSEKASDRIGVCPRVVSLNSSGRNHRVPVRIFNISARPLIIKPQTLLCELQQVKVLRNADISDKTSSAQTANIAIQLRIDSEDQPTLPEGVKLENTKLDEDQMEKVTELFHQWKHVFSTGVTDIGQTDLVKHRIRLNNEEPFKEPYRRIPPRLIQEVREHLEEMKSAGAIRDSESPYSSNLVIVRKKDGSIRFCVDFRKLNRRTMTDAYAIPRVEDSLHLLAGSKFFSKLDLRSGYWQVELEEDDKCKTAFQVGTLGFFEFNRMPFGLCNAPATFQRLMERCMGEMNLRDCLIYPDDIIIFSSGFDEHLEKLEAVFKRLHEHNLKLKGSKCEFFKGQVSYLGHIVSEEGIQTDPEKIEVVRSWPVPTTVKEVRQFLGFTGYYKRFIKGYASIARPLNDLLIGNSESNPKNGKSATSKRKGFEWGMEQQEAFDTLIEKLTSPPVLAYADYQYPFQVHTDASSTGLGAVLYQRQDGKERVVAYASRSLKPAEKNYPAHKLEFLALKWAITEKFHDYLYGSKFEVLTDNNPLTYILTSAKLDATGQRWVAALSAYNFTLTYRCGTQNAHADGLSRIPVTEEECSFPEILRAITGAITVSTEEIPLATGLSLEEPPSATCDDEDIPDETLKATALSCEDWIAAQKSDKFISKVVDFIKEGQRPSSETMEEHHIDKRFLRDWDRLYLEDGVLYRRGTIDCQTWNQLVLPRKLYDIVFQAYHDDLGHQGRDRTISLLKRRFFWPGMETHVEQKIKECGRCIRRKKPPTKAAELVNISTAPMELICIDYLSLERSKGGYENILVITDHFSRYAQAIPTRNQTARTTARVLYEQFFVHYGFPAKIHSDKGANFESKVIQSLCKISGMKKTRTTPYHPWGTAW